MKKHLFSLALTLCIALTLLPVSALAAESIPPSGTAYAAEQTVLIDDQPVRFQTYMLLDAEGNGTNYIKLRDLAAALNGTAAQFEVGYDGSIALTTGKGYTAVGGEMTTPFSGNRPYTGGTVRLTVDGVSRELTALTLLDDSGLGYTYFKLRDLGTVLSFGVDWDTASKQVVLNTSSGTGTQRPSQDNSQSAMARAMLDALNREVGANGNACLVDADGDGVKELITLGEISVKLHDWNNGQLSSKNIGALAGGQFDWWLCHNIPTGEWGVEFQVVGGSYDSSTFFYPSRESSIRYTFSDDGSSDFDSYFVDDQAATLAQYDAAKAQHLRVEYLLSDMYSSEQGRIKETRDELELLLAGKSARDVSDEALLAIAQRLEDQFSSMSLGIMNGWPTECDYSDFIMVDIGGIGSGDFTEYYRVIGFTSAAQVARVAEEVWFRTVSRSSPASENFAAQIMDRYVASNGAIYRFDGGVGDGGIVSVVDRLISRTGDRAVFSCHSTYDGEENLGDFQISLVFEDGAWKYYATIEPSR